MNLREVDPYYRSQFPTAPFADQRSLGTFSDSTFGEIINPNGPLMSLDLFESENEFNYHVDLPGVDSPDISIQDNMLTITGERNLVHEKESASGIHLERRYGKIRRRIMLPMNADADKAQATFTNGVLNVKFPKKADSVAAKKLIVN